MEAGGYVPSLFGVSELADVGAGSEDSLATGDHHCAGRARSQVFGSGAQLGKHRARQSVDLWIVQRDDGHAIATPFDKHKFSHGVTLCATRHTTQTRCEPDVALAGHTGLTLA